MLTGAAGGYLSHARLLCSSASPYRLERVGIFTAPKASVGLALSFSSPAALQSYITSFFKVHSYWLFVVWGLSSHYPSLQTPTPLPYTCVCLPLHKCDSNTLLLVGGRFFSGKCSSLPGVRQFPMIQKMVESMAQLQEEKLRLQEELLALQGKLSAQENEELTVSVQLQDQVLPEMWGT